MKGAGSRNEPHVGVRAMDPPRCWWLGFRRSAWKARACRAVCPGLHSWLWPTKLQITPLFGIFMVLRRVSRALFQRPRIHGGFILKDVPGDATKTGFMGLWSMYWLSVTWVGGQVTRSSSTSSKTGRLKTFDLDIPTSLPINSAIFLPSVSC